MGSTQLQDLGNAVRVCDTLIPALNIQVESVPGYLEYDDGTKDWYGVYFEIMVEWGALLIVDHGGRDRPNDFIYVDVFLQWATKEYGIADCTMNFQTWEDFTEWFKSWKKNEHDRAKARIRIR